MPIETRRRYYLQYQYYIFTSFRSCPPSAPCENPSKSPMVDVIRFLLLPSGQVRPGVKLEHVELGRVVREDDEHTWGRIERPYRVVRGAVHDGILDHRRDGLVVRRGAEGPGSK